MKGTPDSQAFPSEIVACPYVQTSLIPSGGDRKYFGSAVNIRSGDLTGITLVWKTCSVFSLLRRCLPTLPVAAEHLFFRRKLTTDITQALRWWTDTWRCPHLEGTDNLFMSKSTALPWSISQSSPLRRKSAGLSVCWTSRTLWWNSFLPSPSSPGSWSVRRVSTRPRASPSSPRPRWIWKTGLSPSLAVVHRLCASRRFQSSRRTKRCEQVFADMLILSLQTGRDGTTTD